MARIRRISSKTDLVRYIIFKRRVRDVFFRTVRTLIVFFVIAVACVVVYYRGSIANSCYRIYQMAQNAVSKFYLVRMKYVRVNLSASSLIDAEKITQFVINYIDNTEHKYNAKLLINSIKDAYPIIEDISIRHDIASATTNFNIREKNILGILLVDSCDTVANNIHNRLITDNGRTISYVKGLKSDNILLVCGDFNESQDVFAIRKELMNNKLYDKIKYIKFYTSGRFDLMLNNGLLIKMPQKDWHIAILKFSKIDSEYVLSGDKKHIKYIDLRFKDKVYIKER